MKRARAGKDHEQTATYLSETVLDFFAVIG